MGFIVEPELEKWLNGMGEAGRAGLKSAILIFLEYVKENSKFRSLGELVKFQEEATGRKEYEIIDSLVVPHIQAKGGSYQGMVTRYNFIRSFFMNSRAPLPKIKVKFQPTRDTSAGKLTLDKFKLILRSADLRGQAVYLSLFQGLMDQTRFQNLNSKGFELAEQIREKGVDTPFRIEFKRGRKTNPHSFSAYIGKDALEAWKLYFENERGWPKEGEPCALSQRKTPLNKAALAAEHSRLLRRLGLIKGYGDHGSRYGYNLHELRDLARSVLEKAIGDGFNTNSAEFWMGHKVDPLFYNKIWKLDPEYNLEQYRIAEKYLNVISGEVTTSEEVDSLKNEISDLKGELSMERAELDMVVKEDKKREEKIEELENIGEKMEKKYGKMVGTLQTEIEVLKLMFRNIKKEKNHP